MSGSSQRMWAEPTVIRDNYETAKCRNSMKQMKNLRVIFSSRFSVLYEAGFKACKNWLLSCKRLVSRSWARPPAVLDVSSQFPRTSFPAAGRRSVENTTKTGNRRKLRSPHRPVYVFSGARPGNKSGAKVTPGTRTTREGCE